MEERPRTLGEKVGNVMILAILLSLVFGGALLARRNLKLRRSDRAGADRLAMVTFLLLFVSWVLVVDHVADFWGEFNRLFVLIGKAMVAVAIMWLWYIALEPYVRRRWPHALISWSRLLAGRLRDPLVGRDILMGGVFALGFHIVGCIEIWLRTWLGLPPSTPLIWSWNMLLDLRFQVGEFFDPRFVFFALLILFLFLGLRLLLRKDWLALAAVFLLSAGLEFVGSADQPVAATIIRVILSTIETSILVLVPLRFGLLASAFFFFFLYPVLTLVMCGLSGWQSEASWTAILFITAVTVYGFHTALAGRSLFKDELLESR